MTEGRDNMTKKAVAAMLFGGFLAAAGSPAFAQPPTPVTPPAQDGKAEQPGMMMGAQGGMKGMMMDDQMKQKMSKMMDNCNKMMEGMMQDKNMPSASPSSHKEG